jgi:hypothetical protein
MQAANQIDSANQQAYAAAAKDPLFGSLVKALPPPPKVSAFFSGQFLRELAAKPLSYGYPTAVPSGAQTVPKYDAGEGQTAIVV